jgi:hypothetical protein
MTLKEPGKNQTDSAADAVHCMEKTEDRKPLFLLGLRS